MLKGSKVALRPIERADVEVMAAWGLDEELWPEVNAAPYSPRTVADVLKEYDAGESSPHRSDEGRATFAVSVEQTLVGGVALWGIDLHNRRAHLGITLGPTGRGKGYGSDACRVLLRYAFVDRGLHRVQLEVLDSNAAAIRAYLAAGFQEDGRMREAAWVRGRFADELYMSVLASEFGQDG